MTRLHISTVVSGQRIEGDYHIEGSRLHLSWGLGRCQSPTGGIPHNALAILLLRDLFHTANPVKSAC